MIPLSSNEIRIAAWLEARATTYDEAAARNPFTFHRVRADLCRRLAQAIREGKHR